MRLHPGMSGPFAPGPQASNYDMDLRELGLDKERCAKDGEVVAVPSLQEERSCWRGPSVAVRRVAEVSDGLRAHLPLPPGAESARCRMPTVPAANLRCKRPDLCGPHQRPDRVAALCE